MPAYILMINILINNTGHNIPSGSDAFNHLLSFLASLVTAIGIIMFVIGLIMIILALSDNDSRADQRALIFLGVAIVLIIARMVFFSSGGDTGPVDLPDIPSIAPM